MTTLEKIAQRRRYYVKRQAKHLYLTRIKEWDQLSQKIDPYRRFWYDFSKDKWFGANKSLDDERDVTTEAINEFLNMMVSNFPRKKTA